MEIDLPADLIARAENLVAAGFAADTEAVIRKALEKAARQDLSARHGHPGSDSHSGLDHGDEKERFDAEAMIRSFDQFEGMIDAPLQEVLDDRRLGAE